MSKHIELAKKLKALAQRGIGGEKQNAERMLKDLMDKHNITDDDIDGEEIKFFNFKVNVDEKWLFFQVASSIILNADIYGNTKNKNLLHIETTSALAIEIQAAFDLFLRLYNDEHRIFKSAFIQANNIFHKDASGLSRKELSDDEYEKAKRVMEMAEKLKSETFRKQLQHGS